MPESSTNALVHYIIQQEEKILILMKMEYFHTNDVYSCIRYATSGAQLGTSHAQLDTSPLSAATINNSEQLPNELGETVDSAQLEVTPWVSNK